jgi:hypothetical protein
MKLKLLVLLKNVVNWVFNIFANNNIADNEAKLYMPYKEKKSSESES